MFLFKLKFCMIVYDCILYLPILLLKIFIYF